MSTSAMTSAVSWPIAELSSKLERLITTNPATSTSEVVSRAPPTVRKATRSEFYSRNREDDAHGSAKLNRYPLAVDQEMDAR